ncbi:aldehyde dehydrogenase family protein [Streptomyces sp. NPDC088812]|uniref:aldehyde dehydrogenase family protein n=1 Tax=Streptomyces sp. NPDC088812 TaxID=3365905 RepID=UPI00380B2B98
MPHPPLTVDALIPAGLPAGTVNFVTHAPEDAPAVVEATIAHPAVRRVNSTGSTHVGRVIGRLCGEHLTPSVLELGGKAPLVVLDADMDAAVDAAAFGAFANSGQICMSTERIIVDETIADTFVERRVSGVDEAVEAANDSEYGLSAAVFGRDADRALAVAHRIDSGICHVNGPTVHDEPQMPFGGVKASGWGCFGGMTGAYKFTDLRWITVQEGPRAYPFWPHAEGAPTTADGGTPETGTRSHEERAATTPPRTSRPSWTTPTGAAPSPPVLQVQQHPQQGQACQPHIQHLRHRLVLTAVQVHRFARGRERGRPWTVYYRMRAAGPAQLL